MKQKLLQFCLLGTVLFSALTVNAQSEVTLTTVVTFDRTNGYYPGSALILGKDGNLYGTLSYGGWYDVGNVYRIGTDGKCVILATFGEVDGSHPSSLIQGKDGNFYGTTSQGGQGGAGSIFKMTPDGAVTTLATFSEDNAYGPWGLVQGRDGNLYGKMKNYTAESTFKVSLDGKLVVPAPNGMPTGSDSGGLFKAKDGKTYGTVFGCDAGPPPNCGIFFRVNSDGTRTNLILFNGANGENPLPDLVQGRDGNIYGITVGGGAFNQGTVFRINLTGASKLGSTNQQINVPVLIRPVANQFDFNLLDSIDRSVKSYGKIVAEGSNGISGVDKNFALALEYVWEAQHGQRAVKPPNGVTMMQISNAYVMVALWSASVPPRPINFYGKVVDENNQPVKGANAHLEWDAGITNRNPTPFTDTGKISADITTDEAGLFSLKNAVGTKLEVSVGKDGYYTSSQNRNAEHFKYSNVNYESRLGIEDSFKPDSNHPVVYYLHKKHEGAELLGQSFPPGMGQIWQLHHDGTPVELDLLNGSKNPNGSGQLKLELWRDLSDRKANKYDWKLQLSVLNGGLIPTEEEFAFQAPDSGYQSSIVINMPKTNQTWLSDLHTKYFIHLPDGKYGLIEFHLISYNGVFTVHSSINPTGSRNLESK